MDTMLICNGDRRPDAWVVLAELPFNDLTPVYEEIRKLRHALCSSFDPSQDHSLAFFYRGCKFRAVKMNDHIDILASDPNCPPEILFEPLAKLITPLTRCAINRDAPVA